MNQPIRILHLSDFHFRQDKPGQTQNQEDRKVVLDPLLAEIKALDQAGQRPDVVVVTGDIAHSGKKQEYDLARDWFLKELHPLLGGLPRNRLMFVPGNHDADRMSVGFAERKVQAAILEAGQQALSEVMQESKEWLMKSHDAYRAFVTSCHGLEHKDPYWAQTVDVKGQRLGIVGLCSSFMCTGKAEQGSLLLGRYQLNALLPKIEHASLRIALVHHPKAYLRSWDGEDSWDRLRQKCHLILRGHLHQQKIEIVEQGTDRSLEIAAGSAYSNSARTNAFHLLEIEGENLRVQPYQWNNNRWTRDKQTFHEQADGIGHYQLERPDQSPTEPLPVTDAFLQDYRLAFHSKFEKWEMKAMGPAYHGEGHVPTAPGLEDMYQPLRLAEGYNIHELEKGEVLTAEDLVKAKEPLVVRGPAGTGKTTWMRKTYRNLLARSDSFPVFLELRALASYRTEQRKEGKGLNLLAYLQAEIEALLIEPHPGALKRLLKAEHGPRPILLVDGWDELGPFGTELRTSLLALQKQSKRLLVVASSRPYGEGRPDSSDGYRERDLQPLNDGEIEAFAQRFHRHCQGGDPTSYQQAMAAFTQSLGSSPGARDLARTPLLLAMMLFIGRTRPLPDKRHELYEACVENLLATLPDAIEAEGARQATNHWRPSEPDERLRELGKLAWLLQKQGFEGGLLKGKGIAVVVERGQMVGHLPTAWTGTQRHGFINWLVDRAGLLIDRADDSLNFVHLSFQEFLTARHLRRTCEGPEQRQACIAQWGENAQWWETLRLWAALENREEPKRVDALCKWTQDEGKLTWLLGAFFADGLGSETAFKQWLEFALPDVCKTYTSEQQRVAEIFANSRQEQRRTLLQEGAKAQARALTWLDLIRLGEWYDTAGFKLAPLVSSLAGVQRAHAKSLWTEHADLSDLAMARGMGSMHPYWPGDPLEWTLLRCWPGVRLEAGFRLQNLVASGFSRSQVMTHAAKLIEPFLVSLPLDREARDFARYFARDFARYFARYFASDFARYFASDFARYFASDFASDFARYFARDFARDFARYFARDFARYFARDFARYFARYFARSARGGLASWLANHGLPETPSTLNFAQSELQCLGRRATRVYLARMQDAEEPLLQLFAEASKRSLTKEATPLPRRAAGEEPLWAALARQLARQATAADRTLLEGYAKNPDTQTGATEMGLRYLVRGDLLFGDGTSLSLDEICEEKGLAKLPYLEEMPEELELDFDKEESEKGPAKGSALN